MIKMVAAENAIPIESRNMVNPRILSNVSAKNKTITLRRA
jgi:3-deoxy-D-arabino-heptulosonate 7-phosphate (DAHP) synthase